MKITPEKFMQDKGWTDKVRGTFDLQGIIRLLNEYENEISNDFESSSRIVIRHLCENHHPHVSVIITPTGSELLEGKKSIGLVMDYVLD